MDERNSHTLTITFHQTNEGRDTVTTRSFATHTDHSLAMSMEPFLARVLTDHYGRERASVILSRAKEALDRGVA
jgi:hypothetical protein